MQPEVMGGYNPMTLAYSQIYWIYSYRTNGSICSNTGVLLRQTSSSFQSIWVFWKYIWDECGSSMQTTRRVLHLCVQHLLLRVSTCWSWMRYDQHCWSCQRLVRVLLWTCGHYLFWSKQISNWRYSTGDWILQ